MNATTTTEDLAYVAWQDEQRASFERDHIDSLVEEAYQTWAIDRREDGEDDSREAYDDYLDSLLPDD